jgi:hypothetical protein
VPWYLYFTLRPNPGGRASTDTSVLLPPGPEYKVEDVTLSSDRKDLGFHVRQYLLSLEYSG